MKDGSPCRYTGRAAPPHTSLWSLQMASVLSEVCLSVFATHSQSVGCTVQRGWLLDVDVGESAA